MENVSGFLRIFRIIGPFIGEVLFGDRKESAEIMRRNKMVVFLIGCLLVGFGFYYHNAYLYDVLYDANGHLGQELAVLQSRYDASNQTTQLLSQELSDLRSRVVCSSTDTPQKAESGNEALSSLRAENIKLKGENQVLRKMIGGGTP